jgi:hypothetical protein
MRQLLRMNLTFLLTLVFIVGSVSEGRADAVSDARQGVRDARNQVKAARKEKRAERKEKREERRADRKEKRAERKSERVAKREIRKELRDEVSAARKNARAARLEMKAALKRGDQAAYAVALEKYEKAITEKREAKAEKKENRRGNRSIASVPGIPGDTVITKHQTAPPAANDPCNMPPITIPRCHPNDKVCTDLAAGLTEQNNALQKSIAECRSKQSPDSGAVTATGSSTAKTAGGGI